MVNISAKKLWRRVSSVLKCGFLKYFFMNAPPGHAFGSAGAVCSIKESSGPQNQRVHIVLKASKSAGAKGDVPKIYGFMHMLHPC